MSDYQAFTKGRATLELEDFKAWFFKQPKNRPLADDSNCSATCVITRYLQHRFGSAARCHGYRSWIVGFNLGLPLPKWAVAITTEVDMYRPQIAVDRKAIGTYGDIADFVTKLTG